MLDGNFRRKNIQFYKIFSTIRNWLVKTIKIKQMNACLASLAILMVFHEICLQIYNFYKQFYWDSQTKQTISFFTHLLVSFSARMLFPLKKRNIFHILPASVWFAYKVLECILQKCMLQQKCAIYFSIIHFYQLKLQFCQKISLVVLVMFKNGKSLSNNTFLWNIKGNAFPGWAFWQISVEYFW